MTVLPDVTTTSVPLLAGYPHIAGCPICRSYAAEHPDGDAVSRLASVLSFHEGCHRHDPDTPVWERFAF